MIGTVCLKDLKIICIIGIHEKERMTPQALLFDVEMDFDFDEASETENVSATVDYSDVSARLEELAQEGEFQLIETLAEASAVMLFETYPLIEVVRMEIRKPSAVPAASHAAIRVERRRDEV